MKSKFYQLWDRPGPFTNVQKISETIPSKSSLLVFFLLMVFVSGYSQTTPLSFTQIPFGNNDIVSPGRGAEHWFSTAPWDNGTMVQAPDGNTKALDYYIRLNWAQIENAGSGTTPSNPRYNWSTFDFYVNTAINNGWKFHFGILCMAEGYAPFGTPGGGELSYPTYLHNQMQLEASPDWIAPSIGGWVPNWNSPNYLAALTALNQAIANHIATTSYTPSTGPFAGQSVPYSKAIGIIDIRGYGNFGEWHCAPWYSQQPAGRIATTATLKTIIDIHKNAFPNNQLVMIMNAIDPGGSTQVSAEVAHYVCTQTNNVGRFGLRRDNWGQQTFDAILQSNSLVFSGVSVQSLLNEIWKTAPWTGEPSTAAAYVTFGGVAYGDLPNQIRKYHATSFGNGNFCGGCVGSAAMRDSIRSASKLAGYRLILEGGNITSTLNSGAPFSISVNWKNLGISPTYENWNVKYELRNAGNVAVWTGTSSFNPRNFLPSATATVITDNFTLPAGIPSGTYNMVMIIRDPVGYRKPLPLAINGRAADGSYLLSSVSVGAPSSNQPPVANAGTDITITLPTNNTTLNGSASSDPDGTISTYSWTRISGPATFTIGNPASASTALTNLIQATYGFRLVVTDNNGATDSDTVLVTVNAAPPPPNQAPNANAGTDIVITLPTNNTTLNGSASSDPDGTISTYSWSKISGPATFTIGNPASSSTALTNLIQGTYGFRLVVTDNNGATDSDTVLVTVNAALPPPNQAPNANAGGDITITLPTNNTTLNGSASSDPDGTISTYSWTKISGPATFTIGNPALASTALTNLIQGTYGFQLVVTDNNGATDSDTVLVTVNAALPPPNQAPNANAGTDITITLPTNNTTLNGSASTDPDGTISTYAWTKISGPATFTMGNPASASTALTNLIQGTYGFRLVVTDNNGATDSDTVLVIVNAAPLPGNQSPNANAGTDITITLPTNNTTLNGSASSDPDGTIITYSWTRISGPTTFTIGNPASASTALTNLIQGTYGFRLVVTDNNGATGSDSVFVTVNAAIPPANQTPNANAGTDISVNLPNPVILLNGSASSDPDGTIVGFNWIKISGAGAITIVNSTTATPNVVGVQQGVYVFELTVMDNNGATAKDQVTVTVGVGPNQAPVALAGNDTSMAVPASSSLLNGSSSFDSDGSIVAFTWRQVSGPSLGAINSSFNAITSVSSLIAGDYSYELTVTDDKGAIDRDTVTISIVDNLRSEDVLIVYPNPAMSNLNVRCISDSMGIGKLNFYNLNGILEKSIQFTKSQTFYEKQFQIADLKTGMYYIEVIIDNRKRMVKKFIKQ